MDQLKECTERLVQHAKMLKISLWLIGYVAGDGSILGPVSFEHVVDVVLELVQDSRGHGQVIRSRKNRFGPNNEAARFRKVIEEFGDV